jgi:hypothetical protein
MKSQELFRLSFIYIKQEDLDECSQQVSFIAEIYKNVQNVVVGQG